jgi:hypothetical protein
MARAIGEALETHNAKALLKVATLVERDLL